MGVALQDILERKETLLKPNDMTNEQKAKEIAKPCPACFCLWTKDMMYKQEYCKDCVPQDRFTGAMEMAQWKDEQFKEQKKLTWKEVKLIIELDGNIETDNFMGSDEYYQAIADKANVVLFGLQGKLD